MVTDQAHAAIVVGGGTGIGRAVAEDLLRRGVAVGLCGRRAHVLEATATELRSRHAGQTVEYLAADVGTEAEAARVVAELVNKLGSVGIFVGCAGTFEVRPILESSQQTWTYAFGTTFDATLYPALATARRMVEGRSTGRMVLVGSTCSMLSEPGTADYSAAKAAISSLARSMAVDLGPHGIRVNAVCPGWIHTEMVDDFVATADPAMLARINAVGRVGRPEEVAELVGYLALEAPDYLTGASLLIDGGQTAMAPLLG